MSSHDGWSSSGFSLFGCRGFSGGGIGLCVEIKSIPIGDGLRDAHDSQRVYR